MKLALCVITKGDEELESLKRLFASVNGVFDTYHVNANGQETEKTEAWCRKQGIDYAYLPWNKDFSEQRNHVAARVPEDTDYYVWADTDDVVINPHMLRDIAATSKQNNYDVVFFTYWYGNKFDGAASPETFVECELKQMRERLIKPGSVYWKKRIHETPVPYDEASFSYSKVDYSKDYPIAWMHLGARRDEPQEVQDARMSRNQELLELELQEERERGEADPRTILYLMKILAESEEAPTLKRCVELGQEYLEKSGWDQERSIALQLMSRCMGMLGDHTTARDFIHGAIKEFPYAPLLYLYLARVYFNLGDYRAMHFWMKLGMSLDLDDTNTSMQNMLELKVLSAELMLQYYLYGERNIRKAYEAAKTLNAVNPTPANKQNVEYLGDQVVLDHAAENSHKLMDYMRETMQEEQIASLIESLPEEIQALPFAQKYYNRYRTPRTWADDEICYYASLGGAHFEKWDGNSVKRGIGGSETAVIRLAEEWTKLGYKVTVYCDPPQETTINGVHYVPFYRFNKRDRFNIFIQWRAAFLAGRINARKFLVDLHDVSYYPSFKGRVEAIDRIMVKSKYHCELLPEIGEEKFSIISNGIN